MGICLRNKSYGIDMGYGSFYQLRCVIAKQLNKEFGENYANLSRCYSKADFAKNDEIANYWIEKFSLDEDIIDFLYQPDCKGKISPKTCRKIYLLVKDYDDDYTYGYNRPDNNTTFAYFKKILQNCYNKNRILRWS